MNWRAQENLAWAKHNINVRDPKTKGMLSVVPYYAPIKYNSRKGKFQVPSEIKLYTKRERHFLQTDI